MSDQRRGGIAWTDQTWNPVRGCSRVSPGCEHCYAEAVATRFSGKGQPYEGLARLGPNGGRWTGKVVLVEKHLTDPLRWKRQRRVFVNSMSDLFHERIDDADIDRVFAVMMVCCLHDTMGGHTFQVLTKRARRMCDYLCDPSTAQRVAKAAAMMMEESDAWFDKIAFHKSGIVHPRIWLGVSAEDQQRIDERMPHLLTTPAAVRFVSAEPLLGPLDFNGPGYPDWVIVGGESGPGARPCDVSWVRSIVGQCQASGVACFVKQLGALPMTSPDWPSRVWPKHVRFVDDDRGPMASLRDRKGGDMNEWPEDLRVRQFPGKEST